ncbi:PREDICTED: fluoride export protein 2-like [Ipomoea nil]|uniref:fluoride export protein 2-like n=1 Tax=Ipomoea nil TaxID=35883 RepID=UPI000901FA93|nr:PREDICTED: fluoride export protein 2-like [Ipomoea nil]XP_019160604.1 PREDICTED: fluoride export protein 2-like [Ipomoea nil]XP_019160605.1 PREDICTED: fluoride export protein 2-like [Ipomoea nil]XP_019160606.1 PREDICTED: fluoride export protein 2-like [Ipomoea nil]XP_019160607.1 PREDICTED: fluoride export protein 2-like [Ipomoea nil]
MEPGNIESGLRRSASYARSSSSRSLGRSSRNLSFSIPPQPESDDGSESVSEAGDIGDRVICSNRYSGSGRVFFSAENAAESGMVVPIAEEGIWSQDQIATNNVSPVSPSIPDIALKDCKKEVPWWLEYFSSLLFLAVFGILGVLLRYALQKLFGPGNIGATSDRSYMYVDLPSNMVGSFLMGWFGVVFKGQISKISDQLAIGLSTGFLGSLTTFSGWNQKMLDLSVEGRWGFAVLGILIGLFLVAYSIIFGIETAKGFQWILSTSKNPSSESSWKMNNFKRQMTVSLALLLILAALWSMCIALEANEFKRGNTESQLWLACLVGPFGVWIRWFLARLNGRGLGKSGLLKWVPFGTLIANVSAACFMAALATLKKAVKTKDCDTVVAGIQFGMLGCLSTVSTFIAEFHAMRESKYPWRAYAYAMATILVSFTLGTLLYSVPVWTKGY